MGFKALARATSDVAAMGDAPGFLLTLALPAARTGAWLDEFLRGMARAARQLGLCLIGGDTKKYPAVSISITVLGETAPGTAVPRSGARPGDIIYVSGRLGQAQLGLEIIRRTPPGMLRKQLRASQALRRLLQPHLYPKIRVVLGAWLARTGMASALIDISDGLSTDLCVRCQSCGRAPLGRAHPLRGCPRGPVKTRGQAGAHLLHMALDGGDDYELLFTVAPRDVPRLRQAPGFSDLRAIGEITTGNQILLVGPGGSARRLVPAAGTTCAANSRRRPANAMALRVVWSCAGRRMGPVATLTPTAEQEAHWSPSVLVRPRPTAEPDRAYRPRPASCPPVSPGARRWETPRPGWPGPPAA